MKTRISVLLLVIGTSLFFIAALPSLLLANQLPDSSASRLSPQATITPTPVADLSITDPPQLITQLPIEPYQPFTMTVIVRNTGSTRIDDPFYIDVFLDPQEPPISHIPITQSNGYAVVSPSAWSYWNETTLVTITAQIGFAYTPTAHLIYVMADSLNMIGEFDEGNNISPPLIVTSTLPFLQATPSCAAGPDTTINIVGGQWPTDEDVRLFWQGGLETITAAPHSGSFSYSLVKTGLSADVYTIMAASDSYTMTTDFTVPCPANGVPLQAVIIGGEESGLTRYDHLFRLNSTPVNATLPITYRWEATGQAVIMQTDGLMETAVYNWADAGIKTITVTADNGLGIVTDTHQIHILSAANLLISDPPHLITPLPIELYQPISFTVAITNIGESDINNLFFIDVYIDPQSVFTDYIPISQSSGYSAISSLAAGDGRVITITSNLGFTTTPTTHLVYAMADSVMVISEEDETNNVSPPLTIEDQPPSLHVSPSCTNGSTASININGSGWPKDEEVYLFWQGIYETSISAPHSGSFSYLWTKRKLSPDIYEIRAISDSYTKVAYFTIPCAFEVMLTGTETAVSNQIITLTATVSPTTTALPITYTWQINDNTPIIQNGGLTNTLTFTTPSTDTLHVTVTASNQYSDSMPATHYIAILSRRIYLPAIWANN